MFRRRDKRTWLQWLAHALYPRGGWGRALSYIRHRLHRLPDTPEKIARGIFAGVFTAFTPFYGLHFIVSAVLAKLMRGNILAALLATFCGNPLTYVPIGIVSLKTGHLLLGTEFEEGAERSLVDKFVGAGADLKNNLWALVTKEDAYWYNLARFWDEVFFPYLIGGLVPGTILGIAAYHLSVPVIRAYQNRRRGRLKAKLAELRQKNAKRADEA